MLDPEGCHQYHLVILPNLPSQEMDYDTAYRTANTSGNIPNLREYALIYVNHRHRFSPDWYWMHDDWYASSTDSLVFNFSKFSYEPLIKYGSAKLLIVSRIIPE